MVGVTVNNNNVEEALRHLKYKMQRGGKLRLIKKKRFYIKPAEIRVLQKSEKEKKIKKAMKKTEMFW